MLSDVAKFLIHFDTDRGSLRALIYYRKRSFMCLKNHKVCKNKITLAASIFVIAIWNAVKKEWSLFKTSSLIWTFLLNIYSHLIIKKECCYIWLIYYYNFAALLAGSERVSMAAWWWPSLPGPRNGSFWLVRSCPRSELDFRVLRVQ